MALVIEIREPDELDRKTVREFFYAMPLVERGKPLFAEMLWVLDGRKDEDEHVQTLPDYCYHIFDAVRATYFKNLPGLTDTIFIKDPTAAKEAKTIEAAKKVIQVDWRNLGRMVGIGISLLRFVEMESDKGVDGEGFGDCSPAKVREIFTIILGKRWVEENEAKIATEKPDKIYSDLLKQFIAEWVEKLKPAGAACGSFAYQWSAEAMIEFNEGVAEGLAGFMDKDQQFVGETTRSGTYAFLLLALPEIQAMLEAKPRKTVRDLHEWMLPFMRVGVTPYIDIDMLRDVCAPPPSGIGLTLRPLKTRLKPQSA